MSGATKVRKAGARPVGRSWLKVRNPDLAARTSADVQERTRPTSARNERGSLAAELTDLQFSLDFRASRNAGSIQTDLTCPGSKRTVAGSHGSSFSRNSSKLWAMLGDLPSIS